MVRQSVFFVREGLLLSYGFRLGCGFGWFGGPKFSLCDGLGWVEELDPRTTLG